MYAVLNFYTYTCKNVSIVGNLLGVQFSVFVGKLLSTKINKHNINYVMGNGHNCMHL